MFAKRSILAFVFFMSGAALPLPALAVQVDVSHPRIIFHADTIDEVRGRLTGANAALYDEYRSEVERRLGQGNLNSYDADDYAAMYVLSQETEFATAAIEVAMDMVSSGTHLSWEGDGPARSSVVALVYDWCYDRLTSSQRSTIYNAIYPNVDADLDWRQPWFIRDYRWSYLMAIANEGSSSQNAAVNAALDESIEQLDSYFLPCLDSVAPNSPIDGYAGIRIMTLLTFVDALDKSTDYSGPALESAYYLNTGRFWTARFRPDQRWARMPGKYNTSESEAGAYFPYCGGALGDPAAQRLAKYLVDDLNLGKRGMMMSLAWYDPTASSLAWNQMPKDYFDPVSGFVLSRSDWNMGNLSNAIQVGFFNGADQVSHKSQNHFFITRGKDNLINDSGVRFHDLANHYETYYRRTVAHNAILVHDPSESFGDFRNVWGDDIDRPNDGGQQGSDQGEGEERWPLCEGLYGYRGEITRYEATDDYVWVEGDATPAYSSKVDKVIRRFIYLRPDWVLVQDRVELPSAGFPVRSVIHSVHRPTVDGSFTTVEGNFSTGGVFTSTDARQMTIERGDSGAHVYWLQADGGPATLRLIGGANAFGENWRQNFQPEDDDTYSSSQSYEFWVEGRNYTPGYYVDQSRIDDRNSNDATTPGDWRMELEILSQQTVVDITYLVQITPRGAPRAVVASEPLSDGISVSVTGISRPLQFSVCAPGVVCDLVGYTH